MDKDKFAEFIAYVIIASFVVLIFLSFVYAAKLILEGINA